MNVKRKNGVSMALNSIRRLVIVFVRRNIVYLDIPLMKISVNVNVIKIVPGISGSTKKLVNVNVKKKSGADMVLNLIKISVIVCAIKNVQRTFG